MTCHTRHTTFIPPVVTPERRVTPDIFGRLFAEIITLGAPPHLPHLPGWEVRLWPVARLGDATLEARPLHPHLNAQHLREDLQHAGIQILGPIREK